MSSIDLPNRLYTVLTDIVPETAQQIVSVMSQLRGSTLRPLIVRSEEIIGVSFPFATRALWDGDLEQNIAGRVTCRLDGS